MAQLRLPFCSPYKLYWYLFRNGPSAAESIHHVYARYVWKTHGLKKLPHILAYSLAWPVFFCALSWKYTRSLGAKVARATGKGRLRQVLEQFWVAFRFSISPKKYYVFELFRPERLGNARHYIARYEMKGGLHNLLESQIVNSTRQLLNDKMDFYRHCQAHDVATIPSFFLIRKGGKVEGLSSAAGHDLPACHLFAKPLRGRGGRGCERWHYSSDGTWVDQSGRRMKGRELLEHFSGLAVKQDYIVQESLSSHSDLKDLSMNVLTTCRIMSIKNEKGEFEVTHAVFKSSTNPGAIVDNFHRGGIVSRVEMATGVLGPASDSGSKQPCIWYDKHPVTGAQIKGRTLPLWLETLQLVLKAHEAFPDRVMVGWDVAITDSGPVIVEGNVQSGCDMIQRTHDLPAGIGRLAECYAHHARTAIEAL